MPEFWVASSDVWKSTHGSPSYQGLGISAVEISSWAFPSPTLSRCHVPVQSNHCRNGGRQLLHVWKKQRSHGPSRLVQDFARKQMSSCRDSPRTQGWEPWRVQEEATSHCSPKVPSCLAEQLANTCCCVQGDRGDTAEIRALVNTYQGQDSSGHMWIFAAMKQLG